MEGFAFYGIFAAVISCLVGIVAYFADKWISHIDDSIKDVRQDVSNVSSKITTVHSEVRTLKEAYIDQALDLKKQLVKIDAKLENQDYKIDISNSKISQAERTLENYGKVITKIVERLKKP